MLIEGSEYVFVYSEGDEVFIFFEGIVLFVVDYMDDSFSVNEDVSIIVNVIVNEVDDIIVNIFIMVFLLGDYRIFMFIIIDKDVFDIDFVIILVVFENGVVIINGDGIIIYIFMVDFFGEDSFKYMVSIEMLMSGDDFFDG